MTDDWFRPGSEPQARPKKPGGGLLRLIIIVFVVMWLYSKFNRPQANQPAQDPRGPAPQAESLPGQPQPAAQDDWSIEEVETKGRPKSKDDQVRFDPGGSPTSDKSGAGQNKKTTEGDWSIEEVETK